MEDSKSVASDIKTLNPGFLTCDSDGAGGAGDSDGADL